MLYACLSLLTTAASPPCTLDIPAHNVHYDLRGVPGVSGAYEGASDRSVNEGLAEASELLQAGHRSQPWFDITSYDVGRRDDAAVPLGVPARPRWQRQLRPALQCAAVRLRRRRLRQRRRASSPPAWR